MLPSVEVFLREIGVIRYGNHTYCKADKCCEEIANNTEYTEQLRFKMTLKEKTFKKVLYPQNA